MASAMPLVPGCAMVPIRCFCLALALNFSLAARFFAVGVFFEADFASVFPGFAFRGAFALAAFSFSLMYDV